MNAKKPLNFFRGLVNDSKITNGISNSIHEEYYLIEKYYKILALCFLYIK
jgi:hypothetical protein